MVKKYKKHFFKSLEELEELEITEEEIEMIENISQSKTQISKAPQRKKISSGSGSCETGADYKNDPSYKNKDYKGKEFLKTCLHELTFLFITLIVLLIYPTIFPQVFSSFFG